MPDSKFLILALLTVCGNAVEAITGFGSTIIAVTFGARMYDIDQLVVTLVPVNICLSLFITIRHGRSINARELLTGILPLSGAGLVCGVIIFQLADTGILKTAFGVFVFIFSLAQLAKIVAAKNGDDSGENPMSPAAKVFWLVAGGIMQGIYASGGPMVVYYASRKIPDKKVFRSTLSALWLILNSVMFASHAITGKATSATLKTGLFLLPPLCVGIIIGEHIHNRIPEKAFRVFVYIVLTAAGASLIAG